MIWRQNSEAFCPVPVNGFVLALTYALHNRTSSTDEKFRGFGFLGLSSFVAGFLVALAFLAGLEEATEATDGEAAERFFDDDVLLAGISCLLRRFKGSVWREDRVRADRGADCRSRMAACRLVVMKLWLQ